MIISMVYGISCAVNVLAQGLTSYSEVKVTGALKMIMHQGDLSSKISLDTLKGYRHLYALGAAEDLKGEIQILDSKVWNTLVSNEKIEFDKELNGNAALLVYSDVSEWQQIELVKSMVNAELEIDIARVASKIDLDIENPFPFLIKGNIKSLNWHIIDWKKGDTIHSHQKHINSGLSGEIKEREVEILGFYSDRHKTIFTHHSTNMHLHFKTEDGLLASHVDDVIKGEGMELYLPKTRSK